jgi:hypothetical protein
LVADCANSFYRLSENEQRELAKGELERALAELTSDELPVRKEVIQQIAA